MNSSAQENNSIQLIEFDSAFDSLVTIIKTDTSFIEQMNSRLKESEAEEYWNDQLTLDPNQFVKKYKPNLEESYRILQDLRFKVEIVTLEKAFKVSSINSDSERDSLIYDNVSESTIMLVKMLNSWKNWLGKWIEFGEIQSDTFPTPLSVMKVYFEQHKKVDRLYDDWSLHFNSDSTFIKKDSLICYNKQLPVFGSWTFEKDTMVLSYYHSCGKNSYSDLFINLNWFAKDFWYYVYPPSDDNDNFHIYLFKRYAEEN